MSNLDKTLKVRALSPDAKPKASSDNLSREQELALELTKKNAQIEEERKKALESLKIVERMRELLKQEQAKSAELEAKITAAEAKCSATEAKVKELTAVLEKISGLATSAAQSQEG